MSFCISSLHKSESASLFCHHPTPTPSSISLFISKTHHLQLTCWQEAWAVKGLLHILLLDTAPENELKFKEPKNPLKVKQLVNGKAQIWTQSSVTLELKHLKQ